MAVTLKSASPPRAERAVVFACDGRSAPFALVAAEQIAGLYPERDFDICLCSWTGSPEPPGLAHVGIRFCRVATGGLFAGPRLDPGRTQVVYLRLALPAAFAGEYRRLLYSTATWSCSAGFLRR